MTRWEAPYRDAKSERDSPDGGLVQAGIACADGFFNWEASPRIARELR